jgi:uncharacterized membrane protein
MQPSPEVTAVARGAAEWIGLGLEAAGALTIAAGTIALLADWARKLRHDHQVSFTALRLRFSRYLALALEFQLAADILESAISPDWDRVGHLAAIAAIRTALNYFLSREMHEERRDLTVAGG